MHLRAIFILATALAAAADLADTTAPAMNNPAIAYEKTPPHDPVAELNHRVQQGQTRLTFEPGSGYLRSLLQALDIPVESQIAVFSKTSLQIEHITPSNPRTLFFNDSVVVGWMGGGMIEIAAQDPRQGVHFYRLLQQQVARPSFERSNDCLRCHVSEASLGIPGMMLRSMYTGPDGSTRLVYGGFFTDHRSPFPERYGGWYVTGDTGSTHHLGNIVMTAADSPESLDAEPPRHLDKLPIPQGAYLTPYSDIAALQVFDHQMHMTNLITRIGWEARAAPGKSLDAAAAEFVDYLLFLDEAPFPSPMRGASGFAEAFAARGPFDKHARSLRQLDLNTRLLKYPCSYMIYSPAFAALPPEAKSAIYKRLGQVLSGEKHTRLTPSDRRAILEILHDTGVF